MGELEPYRNIAIREARDRVIQFGAGSLSSTELLSLILGTGATQNPLKATEGLLETCQGLKGIVYARLFELEQIPGIGTAKAIQLKSAIELGHRIQIETPQSRLQIRTPADAAYLFTSQMSSLEQEEVHVVNLDARNRLLRQDVIYRGTLNCANMRMGEIFRQAVRDNAASIILAHNHPSLDPTPSANDIEVTREIIKAGKILGIETLDHLIIAGTIYTSLKDRGLGFE